MRRTPAKRPVACTLSAIAAVLSLCTCAKHRAVVKPPATTRTSLSIRQVIPPPPAPRDDGRLPPTAIPLHYKLALRIDPAAPRFSGTTTIDVNVPRPTFYVVLNARGMSVSRALARIGRTQLAATVTERRAEGGVVPEQIVLAFPEALPAGKTQIELSYDAPFAPDLAGLYRVRENGRDYAYTQFESTDARRAFPCFDEPGFKTSYDVTITAPQGDTALANTPEVSHADAGGGMVVHSFASSPPLPSYLVAFAVGYFDIVEGRRTPFPIRAVTTKGRGALAGMALDTAAALIDKLGDYFGIPYPYAKLDLVAVPDFAAGAMENPGLVTFRDSLLLLDPNHATTALKRSQAEVIAHEFAHQWLGDLVTMKWWNDIWLNEGFATWAEAKVIDAWKPNFGATLEQVAGLEHVMDTDALKSARAVREPVRSTSDAMEAFDGLTYQKGAAVLRMIEGWLGPDTFRRGVQRYLQENAWKNADADDLFRAIDYVSAEHVGPLAASLLDRPGVPQVLTSFACDGRGGKLELRMSEWHPLGEGGEPPRQWTIPVCVSAGPRASKSCFTLGPKPTERELGGHCPAFIYPNADEAGYYRFVVDPASLGTLARAAQSLSPAERMGLVSNAWAGVRQGAIAPGVLLDLLPDFDHETNRFVVDRIIDVLEGVGHALVDDSDRVAFQRLVEARLGPRERTLGWWPPNGHEETDDDRALERRSVLYAMGEDAEDDATLKQAEKYALAWLRDPRLISSDTAAVAVPLASMRAGGARLEELRMAAKSATTPEDRLIAIRAMATFDDPAVLRSALDLALTDELKLSDLTTLFRSAVSHRAARPVLYAWEKENWAKLRARVPGSLGRGILTDVAGTGCTRAEVDDARAFFTAATKGMEGVERPLGEALESAGLCVALREHSAADVTEYLKRKGR
ncbi:MAG: M1 family metallopeptidase [Polyangiaceae bacterium]